MKHKKQIYLWKSGIIQALKWTTMSFACLMTFSLGIFLGKKWSDTEAQPINGTSIQLGSQTKEISSEQQESEDIQLKEIASKKLNLKTLSQAQLNLLKETPLLILRT